MHHQGMRAVFVAILVLAAPLTAQNQNGGSVVPDVKELSKGIEAFSYSLFLRMANSLKDSNIVISPFSVWTVMAILSEGAGGLTRDEMLISLGYSAIPIPPKQVIKLSTAFNNVAPHFMVNNTKVQLETISSIFHKSSINTDFEQSVRDIYKAILIQLDFDEEDAVDKVNRFITKATHGRINQILTKSDLVNAEMIITNAIFFNGQWTYPFNVSATKKGVSFYNDQKTEIGQVNMMYQRSVIPFINMKSLSSRIIELPYGEVNEKQKLSMIVILPNENVPLLEVIQGFVRVPVADIFTALEENSKQFEDDEVDVYLPRFSVTSDFVLNQVLMDMGIQDVFSSQYADLSKLSSSSSKNLYLSKVIHKAQIEITEEGTVASAATVGVVSNRNTSPKFVANRPFIYLIVEKSTNLFLIGGVYAEPSLF